MSPLPLITLLPNLPANSSGKGGLGKSQPALAAEINRRRPVKSPQNWQRNNVAAERAGHACKDFVP
jgi:hypothetical protein